ncbi:MAG: type II secretion system F family protein [Candidatus Nanopelagicales bacterium]
MSPVASACLLAAVAGGMLLWAPAAVARRVASAITGAAVAAVVAAVVVGVPAVVVVAGVAGGLSPFLIARQRRARHARERVESWPDAIDVIRAGVRAGAPLGQAIVDAAARVPPPLRTDFDSFAGHIAAGRPTRVALAGLAAGEDPVARRVTGVLIVADRVGSADVGVVLDSLSGYLRADVAQRREVAARHSWNVAAARIAVLAPWLTVAALAVQPEGRAAYSSPEGTVLLIAVGLLTAVAYWSMQRLAAPDGGPS